MLLPVCTLRMTPAVARITAAELLAAADDLPATTTILPKGRG